MDHLISPIKSGGAPRAALITLQPRPARVVRFRRSVGYSAGATDTSTPERFAKAIARLASRLARTNPTELAALTEILKGGDDTGTYRQAGALKRYVFERLGIDIGRPDIPIKSPPPKTPAQIRLFEDQWLPGLGSAARAVVRTIVLFGLKRAGFKIIDVRDDAPDKVVNVGTVTPELRIALLVDRDLDRLPTRDEWACATRYRHIVHSLLARKLVTADMSALAAGAGTNEGPGEPRPDKGRAPTAYSHVLQLASTVVAVLATRLTYGPTVLPALAAIRAHSTDELDHDLAADPSYLGLIMSASDVYELSEIALRDATGNIARTPVPTPDVLKTSIAAWAEMDAALGESANLELVSMGEIAGRPRIVIHRDARGDRAIIIATQVGAGENTSRPLLPIATGTAGEVVLQRAFDHVTDAYTTAAAQGDVLLPPTLHETMATELAFRRRPMQLDLHTDLSPEELVIMADTLCVRYYERATRRFWYGVERPEDMREGEFRRLVSQRVIVAGDQGERVEVPRACETPWIALLIALREQPGKADAVHTTSAATGASRARTVACFADGETQLDLPPGALLRVRGIASIGAPVGSAPGSANAATFGFPDGTAVTFVAPGIPTMRLFSLAESVQDVAVADDIIRRMAIDGMLWSLVTLEASFPHPTPHAERVSTQLAVEFRTKGLNPSTLGLAFELARRVLGTTRFQGLADRRAVAAGCFAIMRARAVAMRVVEGDDARRVLNGAAGHIADLAAKVDGGLMLRALRP